MATETLSRRDHEILAKFRAGWMAVCKPGRYSARLSPPEGQPGRYEIVRTDTLDRLVRLGHLGRNQLFTSKRKIPCGTAWSVAAETKKD